MIPSCRRVGAVLGGVLLAGWCGCASPGGKPAAMVPPSEPQAASCKPLDGGEPPGTLRDVMQRALNPTLSQISLILFHDARAPESDDRNEEVARYAGSLAGCFRLAATLNPQPGPEGRDFDIFTTLGHHNAVSLMHASYQRDRRAQEHWFSHIKETCQACHEQYRTRKGASQGQP